MTTTLVGDRHHASSVGIVQRQRLFTEDVLAGLQALDRKWSVERVRSDVADRVDIRPRQHLFQVRVGYRNSVLLTEGLGTSLIHIYCSHTSGSWEPLEISRRESRPCVLCRELQDGQLFWFCS